jgi:endonuclease/exonuclease/phosphatase family metal-dependent hydrolase
VTTPVADQTATTAGTGSVVTSEPCVADGDGGRLDAQRVAAAAAALRHDVPARQEEGSSELALSEQLAQQVQMIGQLLEQQRQEELQQQQQEQGIASPQHLAGLQQAADSLFSPGGLCCVGLYMHQLDAVVRLLR